LKFRYFISFCISGCYFLILVQSCSIKKKETPNNTFQVSPDLILEDIEFSINLKSKVFLDVHTRKPIDLISESNGHVLLIFRFFAVNCEECIKETINTLKFVINSNNYSYQVLLLNDSYIKTYTIDSLSFKEFYVRQLENELDYAKTPYFFTLDPNNNNICISKLICDLNNLGSTMDRLKKLLENNCCSNDNKD